MNQYFLSNSLITGGYGMVGNNINFGIKPTSNDMDITDINSINRYIFKYKEITSIIHLASINLRDCEKDINKAINVNINGTINMLSISKKLNIPFIIISSGAVFSSKNNNEEFNENTITCPNSIYGYTKNTAEKIALLYEKTILIRTGWLFGGNQKNHYKYVEMTINNLISNSEIIASNDFYGSPTYVKDLVEKMEYLILNLKYGIHHIINSGKASGYDIALEILNYLKKDIKLIKSVDSMMIPNPGPNRSKSEHLITINKNNILRNWKDALNEYLKDYLINKNISIFSNDINSENGKIIWKNRNKCRLCDSFNLEIFFKLESTPLANHFVKNIVYQEKIPLDISLCKDCNHIQLIQIVDPIYQYSNYLYVSSSSNTMIIHLKNNINKFIKELNLSNSDNILEIGANDGICIKYLLDNNYLNVLGIDPAKNINERHNLPIINDFYGKNSIKKIKKKFNSFKLIFGFHCCAHIENINDIFETTYELLTDDGVFIMEVGYFYEVFKNKLFDTIYHEHIDYHTCMAIQKFGLKHNLILFNTSTNNIQGGSIQFYFSKNKSIQINNNIYESILKEKEINFFSLNNLYLWKNDIIRNGRDINYILNSFISNGKSIIGYGAPAKLTTFMYQYRITSNIIKYIIDDNIFKQYLLTPGLHIPIKSFSILNEEHFDYIIIFSWNFVDEIINKLKLHREMGLRIIIPFPEIKII